MDTDNPFVYESKNWHIVKIRSTDLLVLPRTARHHDEFAIAAIEDGEDGKPGVFFYGDTDILTKSIKDTCVDRFRDMGFVV